MTIELKVEKQIAIAEDGTKIPCALLSIEIPDGVAEPTDMRALVVPPGIDATCGVIVSGRAPVWLFSFLTHGLHPTAWIATLDPRLGGAVVTAIHSRQVKIGQVLKLEPAA